MLRGPERDVVLVAWKHWSYLVESSQVARALEDNKSELRKLEYGRMHFGVMLTECWKHWCDSPTDSFAVPQRLRMFDPRAQGRVCRDS